MRFLRESLVIAAAISVALLLLDVIVLLVFMCVMLVVPVMVIHGLCVLIKRLFNIRW